MSDPQVSDAGSDGGQVLYNLAMGAQPEDFPPALQPLAQGYSHLFQPQPAPTPGLLGPPDDIQAAIAQASPVSTPAPTASDDDADADAAPTDEDDDQSADDDQDDDETDGDPSNDDQTGDEPPAAPDPVQRLKEAQKAALNNPKFVPGANHQSSHCNQATYAIARQMGVDLAPLEGDTPGVPARANAQVDNLEKAANNPGSGWKKIGLNEAQGYANQGRMTILGWKNPTGGSGHTASVSPDPAGVASNPSVTQIGDKNHQTNFTGSFRASRQKAVKAYVYIGQ